MFRCPRCHTSWSDDNARLNQWRCWNICGAALEQVPAVGAGELSGVELERLPYPVALTARRLIDALDASTDVLKSLILLKDCVEAAVKYAGSVLLVEYLSSPIRTPEWDDALLNKLVRPSLGTWVNDVLRSLAMRLVGEEQEPGHLAAALFARAAVKTGANPSETPLIARLKEFVTYRNDVLGHGARRRDEQYEADVRAWLPLVRDLLGAVASLAPWRLALVADVDRSQSWMGLEPNPPVAVEPGSFARAQVGHFVLRGPEGQVRDLFPFLGYLPVSDRDQRLHYYGSFQNSGRNALELEYDEGFRRAFPEPVAAFQATFTAELLARALKRDRSRMVDIEGRIAGFGELITSEAEIVGRQFAIDHVRSFLEEHHRGLLVIVAEPGKGKTALMAHLVDRVFDQNAPEPVCFFYRRTSGITSPDLCVRSLFHALLESHNLTEAEVALLEDPERPPIDPGDEQYLKLNNLLTAHVAPRLTPGRPQLIFIDALDESEPSRAGRTAFQRLPDNLPAGIFLIVSTRPVADRRILGDRTLWYDLDAPERLNDHLADARTYVQTELANSAVPEETKEEVARLSAGNFLVLKHLCRHIRTELPPAEVLTFLRGLANHPGTDGSGAAMLGFLYANEWDRIGSRLDTADRQDLLDVVGLLVASYAPLTAELIWSPLGLSSTSWDMARRLLEPYLTARTFEVDGVSETPYRIYHESFADFLRTKTAPDRARLGARLAAYLRGWAALEGYARLYALRYGPRHLLDQERWDDLAVLLLDHAFLEAKAEAGLVHDLTRDFTGTLERMPAGHAARRHLRLISQAVGADIHFLARHPTTLFQCLWNRGWWYDSPEAAAFYRPPEIRLARGTSYWRRMQTQFALLWHGVWPAGGPPWLRPEAHRLSTWLEVWRTAKEQSLDFRWLRSFRPPEFPLGGAELACFRGHRVGVRSVSFDRSGGRIASGSYDGTVRIWDAATGAELACFRGHTDLVTSVSFDRSGRRIASGSLDMTVRVWDVESGQCLEVIQDRGDVRAIAQEGPDAFRWRALSRDMETVIEPAVAGEAVAWFPAALDPIATHHSGRIWAGAQGNQLYIIKLMITELI